MCSPRGVYSNLSLILIICSTVRVLLEERWKKEGERGRKVIKTRCDTCESPQLFVVSSGVT